MKVTNTLRSRAKRLGVFITATAALVAVLAGCGGSSGERHHLDVEPLGIR